uniref:Uncharacterized protein n=1 Tax=Myripristis murdjan TaxID=586833 RepID=A0A667YN25_9TELE
MVLLTVLISLLSLQFKCLGATGIEHYILPYGSTLDVLSVQVDRRSCYTRENWELGNLPIWDFQRPTSEHCMQCTQFSMQCPSRKLKTCLRKNRFLCFVLTFTSILFIISVILHSYANPFKQQMM